LLEEAVREPGGAGDPKLRRPRDENRKLKQLVADLSPDKTIQESLRRKW
jgi:hypothetical protein